MRPVGEAGHRKLQPDLAPILKLPGEILTHFENGCEVTAHFMWNRAEMLTSFLFCM